MHEELISNLINRIGSIIIFILMAIFFAIIFSFIQFNPPTVIGIEPEILNESFIINDTCNVSIKDIIIKNMGPNEINLYARLKGDDRINNVSWIKSNDSLNITENMLNITNNFSENENSGAGFPRINATGSLSEMSNEHTSGSVINISLSRYELPKIKSGSIEFLSLAIDASKVQSPGEYKAAIILSGEEKVDKIIPLTISVKAAKKDVNTSV